MHVPLMHLKALCAFQGRQSVTSVLRVDKSNSRNGFIVSAEESET